LFPTEHPRHLYPTIDGAVVLRVHVGIMQALGYSINTLTM